jgi:hypothetical protein
LQAAGAALGTFMLPAAPMGPGSVEEGGVLVVEGWDPVTDACVPEFWAQESLNILEENMVMAPIVHRDFGGNYGGRPLRGISRESLPSGI